MLLYDLAVMNATFTMQAKKGSHRFFDRHSSFLLVLFCLPLLFLPKINLVSMGARESAGVRIDDLILLLFCLVLFWAHFSLRRTMSAVEQWLLAIVGFSLFSWSINKLLFSFDVLPVASSLFYCLRLLEYFLFFYIGALGALFFSKKRIISAFFWWNALLMAAQKAGVLGQMSVSGYVIDTGRVSGIASFPSEAGMLLNLVFCYLIFTEEKSSRLRLLLPAAFKPLMIKSYPYLLFLLCTVLVIITGSRIAIVALLVAFLAHLKRDLSKGFGGSWLLAALFVAIGVLLLTVMIQKTSAIWERSAGLISLRNLELIRTVWHQIETNYDPIGQEAVRFENYDMSWWMRIHKWCYALKIYSQHPECYLQGIGPGFAMAALDGGFVRILTEYGLIGSLLFMKFFSLISRQSLALKWMVVAFCINMIFFDVHLAYKPMSLLFFLSGATAASFQGEDPGKSGSSAKVSLLIKASLPNRRLA